MATGLPSLKRTGAGGSFLSLLARPYVWAGLAISGATLALALRGVHMDKVADALKEADYLWLVPAATALVVGLYVRALRWNVLFHPATGLRLSNLFGAMNVGYLLTNLLPLRVGELGRVYVISEVEPVGRVRALTTVLVERLLDLLVIFMLLLILLPVVDEPEWATGPALVVGSAVVAVTVSLALMARARQLVLVVAERLIGMLPERLRKPLRDAMEAALDGFSSLGEPSVFLRAVALSCIAWGFSSVSTYCVLRAFGLNITYAAPVFVMVAVALGMVVPSSSGYIGVYHAIAVETLTNVFSVNRDAALSFALVNHALSYLVSTAFGLAYLWNRHTLWQPLLSRALSRSQPEAP